MSATDETQEHIRLLKSQGRITHIVSSTGDVPSSGTALVQRCLSAGLDNPVPLPDGTVAVYAPDGPPSTLEALQMTVMAIAPASTGGSGNRASDADRLVAIDSALRELEGRINGDLRFVRAGPAPYAEAEDEITEADSSTTEAVDLAVADENVGDATSGELSDTAASLEVVTDPLILHPSGDLVEEDADASGPSDAIVVTEEKDLGEQSGSIEPPIIEERADSSESSDPFGSSDPGTTADANTDPLSSEEAATELPFLPSSQATEPSDEAPTLSAECAAEEVAQPLTGHDADEAVNAMAAQIEELTKAIAGQEREITALGAQLAALADRPVPRPDMSEANGHMARFATAFARALERLEAASARLETLQDPQQDTAIVEALEALGARVSVVAEDVAEGSGQAISPDLDRMIALQEVLVRQTATILDARPVGHDLAMSEFLTDLRHTIAELIAEQKRTALAS